LLLPKQEINYLHITAASATALYNNNNNAAAAAAAATAATTKKPPLVGKITVSDPLSVLVKLRPNLLANSFLLEKWNPVRKNPRQI
jgi:hypothetical protein